MGPRPKGRGLMVRLLSGHMRTHYIARWSKSTHSNLREIAGRIAVAVREDTTRLAEKTMARTLPQFTARGAGLGRERRIEVDDCYPKRFGLVFDKLLQLGPGPPMQTRPHPLSHPNASSDVLEILQGNCAAAAGMGFGDDLGADHVVDVSHMSRLPARDVRQQLLCRLRAVALEPLAKCQEAITRISELSTSIERTAACSGDYVLTKIDTQDARLGRSFNFRENDHKMQIPSVAAPHEVCLPHRSAIEISTLEGAKSHCDAFAAFLSKNRKGSIDEPKGTSIDVNGALSAESQELPITPVRTVHPKALRCQVVQLDSITAPVLDRKVRRGIARGGIRRLQSGELRSVRLCRQQPYCDRTRHYHNTNCRLRHMPGTLQPRHFSFGVSAGIARRRV